MRDQELRLPNLAGVNRGVNVLFVEDDDVYAGIVGRMLAEDRRIATASRARDGAEAEAMLVKGEWPDLIITDLAMPKINGAEFLRRAREAEGAKRVRESAVTRRATSGEVRSYVPIVVMTSSDKAHDLLNVLQAAGNSFITKPRDTGELRLLLRALVRSIIRGEPLPLMLSADGLRERARQVPENQTV